MNNSHKLQTLVTSKVDSTYVLAGDPNNFRSYHNAVSHFSTANPYMFICKNKTRSLPSEFASDNMSVGHSSAKVKP
jgi:hypothetical protein